MSGLHQTQKKPSTKQKGCQPNGRKYRSNTKKCLLLQNLFLKINFFLERGWGRETSMCGCLSHAPQREPGWTPRHVPCLGIELATLCFAGPRSIQSYTSQCRMLIILWLFYKIWCLLPFSAAVVSPGKCSPWCRSCLQAALASAGRPSGYILSWVRVTPICSSASLPALLKHWPTSSDMQSSSQWPCSAPLILHMIAMRLFFILGGDSSLVPHYSPTPMWIQIQQRDLRSSLCPWQKHPKPRPTPGPSAQDSSARKISPHNFWTSRDWVAGGGCWNP